MEQETLISVAILLTVSGPDKETVKRAIELALDDLEEALESNADIKSEWDMIGHGNKVTRDETD